MVMHDDFVEVLKKKAEEGEVYDWPPHMLADNQFHALERAGLVNEGPGLRPAYIDVVGKVQYLVNWMKEQGLLEDGVFTFPDGETWEADK